MKKKNHFNEVFIIGPDFNIPTFFFQWRKFHFFDLKHNVDGGRLSEIFKVML